MIKEIIVRDFRCIEDVSFSPKDINIFVGRNNTGKSSMLYAIATGSGTDIYSESHSLMKYLIRIPQKKAEIEVNFDNIGIKAIIFRDFDEIPEEYKHEIYSKLEGDIQKLFDEFRKTHKLEIDLDKILSITIGIIKEYSTAIVHEYNLKNRGHLISLFTDPPAYAKLRHIIKKELQLPKKSKEKIGLQLTRQIAEALFYYFEIGTNDPIKEINLNFYSDLEDEIDADEKTLFILESLVKKIYPELKRLGRDVIVLKKNGELVNRPLEIYGDGLKALLTVLNLLVKSEKGILILEEPENHLHPGYLSLLIKYLIEYSEKLNVQLFISTHSLDLLDEFLKYENLKDRLQIVRMYKDEDKEKVSSEVLSFDDAKEEYEKLKLDLRGI